MNNEMKRTNVTEKILNPMNGAIVLLLIISGLLISIAVFAASM